MSEYKRLKGIKTVLAVCLADREETYHRWQVFSHRADGVCIEFDREKLLTAFDMADGETHRYVTYELVSNANSMRGVNLEIFPLIKCWPYGDELNGTLHFFNYLERSRATQGHERLFH